MRVGLTTSDQVGSQIQKPIQMGTVGRKGQIRHSHCPHPIPYMELKLLFCNCRVSNPRLHLPPLLPSFPPAKTSTADRFPGRVSILSDGLHHVLRDRRNLRPRHHWPAALVPVAQAWPGALLLRPRPRALPTCQERRVGKPPQSPGA